MCDFSIDMGCSKVIRAFGAALVYLRAVLAILAILVHFNTFMHSQFQFLAL